MLASALPPLLAEQQELLALLHEGTHATFVFLHVSSFAYCAAFQSHLFSENGMIFFFLSLAEYYSIVYV